VFFENQGCYKGTGLHFADNQLKLVSKLAVFTKNAAMQRCIFNISYQLWLLQIIRYTFTTRYTLTCKSSSLSCLHRWIRWKKIINSELPVPLVHHEFDCDRVAVRPPSVHSVECRLEQLRVRSDFCRRRPRDSCRLSTAARSSWRLVTNDAVCTDAARRRSQLNDAPVTGCRNSICGFQTKFSALFITTDALLFYSYLMEILLN